MNAPSNYIFNGNFGNSNSACPLISLAVELISGGTTADITSSDGIGVVTMASSTTDTNLQVSIPSINTISHFYLFRVSALATGGATAFTADVKILMRDCSYNTISPPSILPNTAGETFYKMFTTSLNYVLP